jgi:hypothetical protein
MSLERRVLWALIEASLSKLALVATGSSAVTRLPDLEVLAQRQANPDRAQSVWMVVMAYALPSAIWLG